MSSTFRTLNPLAGVFNARLRAALDARNVAPSAEGRATQLALRTGRSISATTRWVNGETLPALEIMVEIAKQYEISLDYLLGLSQHDAGTTNDGGLAGTEAPRDPQPVLIVDDDGTSRLILDHIAREADPATVPMVMGGPVEALRWATVAQADLVITDYRLPGFDGLEFVRQLRRLSHFAETPVLMVTIVEELELRHRALQQGINDFLRKPIDTVEGVARCRNLLAVSRQQALLRDRSALLAGLVAQRTAEMQDELRRTLELLAELPAYLQDADPDGARRVGTVAGIAARALELPADEADRIELAAPLRDVGIAALPLDAIRDGRAASPRSSFAAHTTLGYRLLKSRPAKLLRAGALIALGHHERYDGTGYPTGLSGDHIPLAARIVAAAERLEELRSRGDVPWSETWQALREERFRGLDPAVVDALLECATEVESVYGAQVPPGARATGKNE